jgi:tetratricopeptide (TPR) repeat protein
MFFRPESEGVPFFLELKERIEIEFKPDFLLIDSRTGVTEMGGVCTALLPDKVVFLITNNQENIDGACQIIKGIRKVKRLPGQKPINVAFALTRIPFPETPVTSKDKDVKDDVSEYEKMEKEIVDRIVNSLNESIDIPEERMNVENICILHSDRRLEMSESLRLGESESTKETSLTRDYLRLFSEVISNEIILPRITGILDEITTNINLLTNPDEAQNEFEDLVSTYPHPESLKRLILFYALRNEEDKLLNAIHDLWKTYGIEEQSILSKYISYFMRIAFLRRGLAYLPTYQKFKPEIIEKALVNYDQPDKTDIERRLAELYKKYNNFDLAINHYLQIVDKVKDKDEILNTILDLYIEMRSYNEAIIVCERYSDVVNSSVLLRAKKIESLFKMGELDKLKELSGDDAAMGEILLNNPSVYYDINNILGNIRDINKDLDIVLRETIASRESSALLLDRLLNIGKMFFTLGREDEFRAKVKDHPVGREVINRLK